MLAIVNSAIVKTGLHRALLCGTLFLLDNKPGSESESWIYSGSAFSFLITTSVLFSMDSV